jgi:hypothetical protein
MVNVREQLDQGEEFTKLDKRSISILKAGSEPLMI